MKKTNLNILKLATLLTMVLFLMDGDIREPIMLMRFVEFFMMTGILFTIISIFYHLFVFAKNRVLKN